MFTNVCPLDGGKLHADHQTGDYFHTRNWYRCEICGALYWEDEPSEDMDRYDIPEEDYDPYWDDPPTEGS